MKKTAKGDKLFSTTDNIILITTLVLCLGLEVASVLPVVQDKIYETKYNKLIEQGLSQRCATINAKSQTQSARAALYFDGLAAGLIGMGVLGIKKSIELERAFKKISDECKRSR